MKKTGIFVKIALCVISVALILAVTVGIFLFGTPSTGVRTERDLNNILTLIIIASVLLFFVIVFGVFALIINKRNNDRLLQEFERENPIPDELSDDAD